MAALVRSLRPLQQPIASLTICFILWKTLLIAVAWISPGLGYDTSSTLLLAGDSFVADVGGTVPALTTRLTRWDAIYFAKISERGYIYEQEWAFGWGFTRLLSFIAKASPFSPATTEAHVWAGIVVSHTSHLASVLVLYSLVQKLHFANPNNSIAFASATLHIISPAGIFLSAPYGESLFSLLTFTGVWLLVHGTSAPHNTSRLTQDVSILTAGAILGVATTVRSNGIFNALMIAYEFAHESLKLPREIQSFSLWRRLVSLGVAGIFLTAGFIVPQVIAFYEICGKTSHDIRPRAWCDSSLLPSIYTWVQKHYWGSGFFKYWTISNIPLFILSGPMLYILLTSALQTLRLGMDAISRKHPEHNATNKNDALAQEPSSKPSPTNSRARDESAMLRLALPQSVLALLAITYFHVQIINRISSGYPLWYIWLAYQLVDRPSEHSRSTNPIAVSAAGLTRSQGRIVVRGMVMYGIVQADIYALGFPFAAAHHFVGAMSVDTARARIAVRIVTAGYLICLKSAQVTLTVYYLRTVD